MKQVWEIIKYDLGNEPVDMDESAQEEDVIPILENMTEEDFTDNPLPDLSAEVAVEVSEDKKSPKETEDDDNSESEGSQEEVNESEDDEKEGKHIPGLPKL